MAILNWLQSYWGVFVGLGLLIGVAQYLDGILKGHAEARVLVARWLVVPSYHDAYRDWLGRQLDRLDLWMGGLWSWTALARCLAIAFIYPIAFLLLTYGLGGPGTVGRSEILPSIGGWHQPTLGFGLLLVIVVLGLVLASSERIDRYLLAVIDDRLARRGVVDSAPRAQWFYRLGGASAAISLGIAIAFYAGPSLTVSVAASFVMVFVAAVGCAAAGLVMLAATIAVVGAISAAVIAEIAAGTLALAQVGALAGAGVFSIALAAAGAEFLAFAGVEMMLAGAVGMVIGLLVTTWSHGFIAPLRLVLLIVFILPIANALLDWPSWAISRWLGRDLHNSMHDRPRPLTRLLYRLFPRAWKSVSFIVHVMIDLGAAMVLLVGLAVLLAFLIEAFNDLIAATGGDPPLALHGFLTSAVQRPWPDGAWAFSMLLTTLIPTALHAGAAILMLLLLPMQPLGWREWLAKGLAAQDDSARAWACTLASWLAILTPLLAGTMVIGLGYALVWLIGSVWQPVASLLLEAALFGMRRADHLAFGLSTTGASGD